jgi:hypothetical protein
VPSSDGATGCNDSSSVANAFASHFSKVYMWNASSDNDDIKLLLDGYSGKELNASDFVKLINVEEIDNLRNWQLKKFKTGQSYSGPDHLCPEHFVNA